MNIQLYHPRSHILPFLHRFSYRFTSDFNPQSWRRACWCGPLVVEVPAVPASQLPGGLTMFMKKIMIKFQVWGTVFLDKPTLWSQTISIHLLEWAERIHRRFPWKTSARRFESLILGIAHGLTKVDHRMKVHFFYFYSCVRSSFCDCLARYKNIVFNPLFRCSSQFDYILFFGWIESWNHQSVNSYCSLTSMFPECRQTSAGVPMVFAPWWYDCVSAVSFVFSCILRVGISWHDIPTIEWTSIYMINYIHIIWLCIYVFISAHCWN